MTVEKGTVESIDNGWAWVLARRTNACGNCGHKQHCQVVEGMDRMAVRAKNVANARIGDEVELYLSGKTKFKGLFILYIFPVVGLLIGTFSADSLSGVLGLNKDLGMGLFALSGLILAFVLVRFVVGRMEARQELTPMISRVVGRTGS